MFICTLAALLKTLLLNSWLVLKPMLGWFFIVIGLIGMPMPIVNGIIFVMIGVALVGHRNRTIRWSRVHIKLLINWWAGLPTPVIGFLGRLARRTTQEMSRQHRRLHWWWQDRQKARREAAALTKR